MQNSHSKRLTQITVKNSGVILLGPYLQTLFTKLNLLEEGDFVSLDARKKAVLILYYTITKNEVINKTDELALLKILCGIHPLEEIIIDVQINNIEIQLVESMLSNVLKNWKQLSTNSIEGFRESFLIREGDLTEDEKAYILLVDKKPFDVLLDSLPWQYRSLKLSWMKKFILISW